MFQFAAAEEICFILRWAVFQEGRFLGRVLDEWIADSQEFLHTELPRLIVIFIIAFIFSRLLRLVTYSLTRAAGRHDAGPARAAQVRTLAGVIHATGLAIIVLIATLQALNEMGFNLGPVLASAGVAGVAIGLAAQTIVKDVLNGIMILVEGQFNVGDTVRLAGLSGTVEAMTLRKTSVRDGDGTLYEIPNSQITTVANLSAGYSVATVNVSVDFSADPDEVTKLLKQIADEVAGSDEFKNDVLEEPQVLGVDAVKGSQVIFPVVFKTRAMKQYGLVREFQRRVRLALEEHHMLPGDPNRIFSAFMHHEGGDTPAGSHNGGTPPAHGSHEAEPAPRDPTTLKPQETNPFSGE